MNGTCRDSRYRLFQTIVVWKKVDPKTALHSSARVESPRAAGGRCLRKSKIFGMTRELRSLEPSGIFSLGHPHRTALARIEPAQATPFASLTASSGRGSSPDVPFASLTGPPLGLSVRQDKYGCTGCLDMDCSVTGHTETSLADWKGEACVARRATGRTGKRPVRRARGERSEPSRLSDPYPRGARRYGPRKRTASWRTQ